MRSVCRLFGDQTISHIVQDGLEQERGGKGKEINVVEDAQSQGEVEVAQCRKKRKSDGCTLMACALIHCASFRLSTPLATSRSSCWKREIAP